jgi:hypothetical protein
MLLLACLYFTMLVLQHSNSQLLQLLHLHHCLQRAKSQVLARKIIWTPTWCKRQADWKFDLWQVNHVWQIVSLWTFDEQKMITTCISLKKSNKFLQKLYCSLTWKSYLTFIIDMYKFTFLGMSTDNQAFPFLHTTPYTQCEWVSFATAASFTNLSWGSWVWTRIDNNLITVGMRYVS